MKKIAICILFLILAFPLFTSDSHIKNMNSPQLHFHGKRMMQKDYDFFAQQIGVKKSSDGKNNGTEIIFIFSVPVDSRSIQRKEIFINGKPCSENVKIRFTKSGNGVSFFIPDDFRNGEDDSENFSIELGNLKSYNGTLIEKSNFENIEIGKNAPDTQMKTQKIQARKRRRQIIDERTK